jgi:hypothetical protein
MNRNLRLCVLAVLGAASPALAQLAGTGELTCSPGSAGNYNNTIVIHNTGSTTIGTFWFAWIPGEDFLPSLPGGLTAPPGWYAYVEQGIYDSYSIQWYAYTPAFYIQPGQSLSGFGFSGPDTPQTLAGLSPQFPRYNVTDSYLYVGPPEYDPGYLLHVSVTVGSGNGCGSADFNCDGDVGTDADIESFFACLSGTCPAAPCTSSADFNADGDVGTDADIESFFRVLAGGPC